MVWIVFILFVVLVNCVCYCGVLVDFVDIDLYMCNFNVFVLVDKLYLVVVEYILFKVIVVVYFIGSSNDMVVIVVIIEFFNIILIEDVVYVLGVSDFQGYKVGVCKYFVMIVLSFYLVKLIISVEGGVVLMNDDELVVLLCCYVSYGIMCEFGMLGDEYVNEFWFYVQFELGYNYWLSDLYVVFGCF